MKALIDRNLVVDTGGNLVVDTAEEAFDVHSDYIWVDCPDYVTRGDYSYDGASFTLINPPMPVEEARTQIDELKDALLAEVAGWGDLTSAQTAYKEAIEAIDSSDYTAYDDVVWPERP